MRSAVATPLVMLVRSVVVPTMITALLLWTRANRDEDNGGLPAAERSTRKESSWKADGPKQTSTVGDISKTWDWKL